MKKWQKMVFIGLLITTISFQNLEAQYYEVPLTKRIANSTLVVEGEVIESIPFQFEGKTFTSNKIKIFNCFPLENSLSNFGQSQECLFLYIITKGGVIEEESQFWAHALKLYKGDTGLFFLNYTERPALYSDFSSFEVFSGVQGFIEYQGNDNRDFIAKDIFSTYLNPEQDLIVPILEQSGVGYFGEKSFIRDKWMLCFLIHNFSIENDFLNFDLSLKSRWGNPFSINDFKIQFKYDEGLLGQDPMSTGKLEFTTNNSLEISGNNFNFQQLQDNIIDISISNNQFSGIDFPNSEYIPLLSAKVNIQGISIEELDIPYFETNGNIYSIFNDEGILIEFEEEVIDIDLGVFSDFLNGEITSIVPDDVGAGILANESFVNGNPITSGIVTISGSGFDDLDENTFCDILPGGSNGYRVEFKLFDGAWVTPLCTDYIKWDDDEIIVQVPSHGHKVTYFLGIPSIFDPSASYFAATGDVRVRTEGSNPTGSEEVTVDFVHRNGRFNNDAGNPKATRALLKGKDSEQEGYELYFTQAFKDNLGVSGQDAFKRALDTWRCETLVNFEIKEFSEIVNQDFACAIDFGIVEAGTQGDVEVLGITPSDVTNCSPFQVDDEEVSVNSFSITFSNEKEWHAGTSDVPSGKIDLETVALHELGHALQLFHVINEGAVMEPIAAIQRRSLTQAEINGGIHVVQVSNQAPVCTPPMIPLLPGDCLTNTFNAIDGNDIFKVIPNPSSTIIYIQSIPDAANEIILQTIYGTTIIKEKIIGGENIKQVDISNLPKGIYLISIAVGINLFTQKIIK